MSIQLRQIRTGLLFAAQAIDHRAICRKDAELSIARGFRARRYDGHIAGNEIRPVVDMFRVAFANNENDGGSERL